MIVAPNTVRLLRFRNGKGIERLAAGHLSADKDSSRSMFFHDPSKPD